MPGPVPIGPLYATSASPRCRAGERVLHRILGVGTGQTTGVVQLQEFPRSELDRKLSEIADRRHLPGFTVAVVSKIQVLFQKGYGLADMLKKTPYSPQSLQNIGPVSKTFIGIALMQLVEQGRIKLDEDINKHLPFKVVNPNYPQDVITVRHLANHTSTLTDTKEYVSINRLAYRLDKRWATFGDLATNVSLRVRGTVKRSRAIHHAMPIRSSKEPPNGRASATARLLRRRRQRR